MKVTLLDQACWHCGVVLTPAPKPRCENCPPECDVEGCQEMGCDETFSMPSLTDECVEVAYSAIRVRGLHEHLENEAWHALAKEQGELIEKFALDLVDQKLAEIDAEKERAEAA